MAPRPALNAIVTSALRARGLGVTAIPTVALRGGSVVGWAVHSNVNPEPALCAPTIVGLPVKVPGCTLDGRGE